MPYSKELCLTFSVAATLLGGSIAFADDTEIFFGSSASATKPNVLLIIDTSGSMDTKLTTRKPYDPSGAYTAVGCPSDFVYYSTSGVPTCGSSSKIPGSGFFCSPAAPRFASTGKYFGNAVRWMKQDVTKSTGRNQTTTTTAYFWNADFNPRNGRRSSTVYTPQDIVTCEPDTDSNYPGIGNSTNPTDYWSGTGAANYFTDPSAIKTTYTFYSAHYVTWYNDPTQIISASQSRLDVVKAAAKSLIDSLTGVNVGIMVYNSSGDGGKVIAAVQDVTSGASVLKTALDGLTANGNTPLSESLYEAYLYFSGGAIKYGTNSVAAAKNGLNYKSPITSSCQNNYIVFLTDGLPNQDDNANTNIEALDASTSGCYSSWDSMWTALGVPKPNDTGAGLCLKEQSRVLFNTDILRSMAGTQNATTYFIGFGDDVSGGAPQAYLMDAGKAGGGTAETATDSDSLTSAFDKTVGTVMNTSASFTSPSVAVDSFNKTQVLEDLYVAMFKPSKTAHWPGNLKKFKLRNNMIVGQDTAVNAINPSTGFFTDTAKDYWQSPTETDTDTTTKGGAANVIPAPTARKLYTYIGDNKPGALQALAAHPVETANTTITDALLRIGGAGDPALDVLINWARGDDDGDLTTMSDIRYEMGDPIHSQPAVVIYGVSGTTSTDKINDAVTYVTTNDGYLHAVDVVSGQELWSYIPQELLGDLKLLYQDALTTPKHYSLDGNLLVLRYDVKNDGAINATDGDRVFLYFSQGRGGERYYALDVTNKNSPQFMWSLGASDLGGVVHWSWSTPTIGRVKVGTGNSQNTQRFSLIFGGGYDPVEDAQPYNALDSFGNGVFIVDAVKGALLWSQTKTTTGSFANMTHAIPSSLAVLDVNNDGWTDRLYVGDMAGQIWRFDISNGNPTETLVAGGVIASLGGKVSPTVANNRSFYNTPDVALFTDANGASYYNIALGSGDRGLPRSNVTTQDRFYSLRDYRIAPMTQDEYDAYAAVTDAQLTTIDGLSAAPLPPNSRGWKLPLSATEKSLAQSTTAGGTVLFTTYIPMSSSASSTSCTASSGSGRAYALNVATGVKRFSDLYQTFATTGLPPSVSIVNQNQMVRTDGSTNPPPSGPKDLGTCLSGVTILGNCVNFGSKVKTFWQDASAP